MTPHVSRGTGELPLTARLLPSATRLYPALEAGRWYQVTREEELGVFIEVGIRPLLVFAQHVEVRT